jgi:hypothetical protein
MKKASKRLQANSTKKKSAVRISSKRTQTSAVKARRTAPLKPSAELPPKKSPEKVVTFPSSLALYVYGVTEIPSKAFSVTAEAVDGVGVVEPIAEGSYLCWASRVSRQEFAESLQRNMEDLEWLAACSIRHQKVLSEISEVTQVLPARFGTIFLSPESLLADFREKLPKLKEVFKRISNADEWGVKIFGTAPSRPATVTTPTSGVDYLRQKSAALQNASAGRHDEEADRFGEELAKLSEASVPGGKASTGQPGLIWSGSFLVKRPQKKRFDQVLKRYAERWAGTRRIDVSGPWPPYSFVSEGQ